MLKPSVTLCLRMLCMAANRHEAPRAHRSMEGRSVPFLLQGGIFPAALPAWFGDDLGVKAGIDWEGVIICPAAHLYS